jgi:hypothetical protein
MILTGMNEVLEENFLKGTLFIANPTGLEVKSDFRGVNSTIRCEFDHWPS